MNETPDAISTITYIGKPCKRGHDGLRYRSSGGCVGCFRARKPITMQPSDGSTSIPLNGTQYLGAPCRRGHDGSRYRANGNCVACEAERRATGPRHRAERDVDPVRFARLLLAALAV